LHGGGQEVQGRSGTLSPALCAGFGAAAALAAARGEQDMAHVDRLFARACKRLGLQNDGERTDGAGGWMLNGSAETRYRGNLNIRRDGLDVARLMADLRGIAFSAGSACASGSGRPSHVLRALGISDRQARSSLRIGFGRDTREEAFMTALDRIAEAADRQRVAA
ncbi:aminotransferase, partial [Sphingomonas sp. RS6]